MIGSKATYPFNPRWKITAQLRTNSPLHIGNGETTKHSDLKNEQGKAIEINACIKDARQLPYIPGTTLKGKLLAWLKLRIQDEQQQDLNALFGEDSDNEQSGRGGRAEFHDARLITPLKQDGKNYPYWQEQQQTYIEVSTVINRITRTVADRKLFHTELVPPGVGFEVVITGMMTEAQANLIIAALQSYGEPEHAATLGAEDTSGKGRMFLFGNVQLACMDAQQVRNWLATVNFAMANTALSELSQEVKEPRLKLAEVKNCEVLELSLQMDGAFLINNPTAVSKDSETADHQPLLDAEGKPLLTGKSLRGALRAQAEKIARSLGFRCCDSLAPCSAIFKEAEVEEKLCPVCQVFGATGWQSPLHIHPFKYAEQETRPTEHQDFVAIDRFHGGGKLTAKFDASYYVRPLFKGRIELDQRLPSWGKGLLALVLRDLKDGDIKLGFGANKGYGGIETIEPENLFTDADINKFRATFKDQIKLIEPTQIDESNEAKPEPINSSPRQTTDNYFYNPYQFIPVNVPNTETWLTKEELTTKENPHSHALYRSRTDEGEPLYHGQLSCTLTAETPFFIGAKQHKENSPATVDNYEYNGELAIPATSLRGMISSLAEAASNSALRVLDNGLLSYRKSMDNDKPLADIGVVVERKEGLKLIPLKFKVYLMDAYQGEMQHFLQDKNTWSLEYPEIYYLKPSVCPRYEQLKASDGIKQFKLNPADQVDDLIIPAHKAARWQKEEYTPGILRILGKNKRSELEETNKKNEYFLPVPKRFVDDLNGYLHNTDALSITPEVKERFEELADQRSKTQKKELSELSEEECLPFNLKGTKRDIIDFKNEPISTLRLKPGDLVYYKKNRQEQVQEVSFSALWRGRVENIDHQAAKVLSFFPKDLLPFNSERDKLSPAELLFGFVQGENSKGEKPKDALAFAGKVRIDTGRLATNKPKAQLLEPAVTLKILASPKLPSPALYFRTKIPSQEHIAKHELSPERHQAKGRKQYLHALRQQNSTAVQQLNERGRIANAGDRREPWRTHHENEDLAQKVSITPIKAGTAFTFNLDFDNLTAWELGLLCYALKPSKDYRHKLGMGKPIGLGSVNIDITDLKLIDRQKRYANDTLSAERYNGNALNIDSLRNQFIDTMDKNIRQAIELLGNPANIKVPVHYPQKSGQDIEKETYQWFVNNDGDGKQQLLPIAENTTELPPLNR